MHYEPLERALPTTAGHAARAEVRARIDNVFSPHRHGDLPHLLARIGELPNLPRGLLHLDKSAIQVGSPGACPPRVARDLEATLRALGPWRKGPFVVFGIHVDAEWRCDMKWQRVAPHLAPLDGRTVLDVGCGNGYYCLRMLGAGAGLVVGLEPNPRFALQFEALRRLMPPVPASVLPLRLEDLPDGVNQFDTVFSMGVLYHRRSAARHLESLFSRLAAGGQLVLETLTLPEGSGQLLVPRERYANMRNVWAIPAKTTLLQWVRQAGFEAAEIVSTDKTTSEEQRATTWMPGHSLLQALARDDDALTVEGYPAPRRSVVIATKARD